MSDAGKTVPPAGRSISVDGKTYSLDGISDGAKAQIANLRATEAELKRLGIQTAIFQTARSAYARALKEELEKAPEAGRPANGEAAAGAKSSG